MEAAALRTKQRGGNDGDPIRTAVGNLAGRDHHRVQQLITDPVREPLEVSDRAVVNRAGQLYLDRQNAPVLALDDEVYLSISSVRAKVADRGLGALGIDPDTERHQ